MKRSIVATLCVCVFVFAAIFGMSADQAYGAKEKRILLKVPVSFSTALPGLGDTILWIAEKLEAASGGSIVMKVFEPGKLVHPFEIMTAVSAGKINAGYGASGYWRGKLSTAADIFTAIPFGPEAPEYLSWIYYGNGAKLYQELYDRAGFNVKVIPATILSPESSGWFTKEIKSVEDLKGLKMRFFGLGGKAMQKLGVSVTLLPAGELFPALEKKTIDATEFSMPAIDKKLGFYKIAKHNYFPGWHQQATILELLINKDTWNGMSPAQQALIEVVCMANMANSLAYCEAIQGAIIKENIEKHGVTVHYWPDEMLQTFNKAWMELVEELYAEDEFFKKVWDDLTAFRAEYAYWSKSGFLPRGK